MHKIPALLRVYLGGAPVWGKSPEATRTAHRLRPPEWLGRPLPRASCCADSSEQARGLGPGPGRARGACPAPCPRRGRAARGIASSCAR